MNAPSVIFTPSATVSYPVGSLAAVIALPAADGANPSVVLKNNGPGMLVVVPGSVPGPLFNLPGAITLAAGQQTLTTAAGLANGTVACVQSQGGASLQFMRGSVAELWTFAAPGAALI